VRDGAALDRLTGLIQSRNVSPAEFPPGWREAPDFIGRMNREQRSGRRNWRTPSRRKLRGLLNRRFQSVNKYVV